MIEKAWPADDASLDVGLRSITPLILEGLANVRAGQMRFDEAIKALEQAAALRFSIFGPGHFSMTGNRTLLGQVCRRQGNEQCAERAFQEALENTERAIGKENEVYSHLLGLLADSCVAQGKHEDARALYEQCVKIDAAILPPDNQLRILHRREYENLLRTMGLAEEAEILERPR